MTNTVTKLRVVYGTGQVTMICGYPIIEAIELAVRESRNRSGIDYMSVIDCRTGAIISTVSL